MKLNLPRLQNLADVRKYLMVIETLELNKLNNAISVNADMHQHRKGIQDLRTLKQYYGDLTEFLFKKQTEARLDDFEKAFVLQLEDFVRFWQVAMNDFRAIYDEEMERVLERNEELKGELNEMLEKTLGFQAPPNALFLNLLAIRKLAVKLRHNEATQFLNFDFFKKHNERVNEKWVKDRRSLILTRLEQFERRLAECTETIKYKLNLELAKLHAKRTKQFERLMVKYGKVRRSVEGLNHKEIHELKKLKEFFIMKHAIPVYYHTNDMFKNGILEEVAKPGVVDDWEPVLEPEPAQETTPQKKGKGTGLGTTGRKEKEKEKDARAVKAASKDKKERREKKEAVERKPEYDSAAKGKKEGPVVDKKQTAKA